ncbi:50S ribosomal protein L16 [Candidatus Dojkabacteria bacterium]|nr:50S ribosomal protein L16 [Candidatus Dojkabacteria bacterium]
MLQPKRYKYAKQFTKRPRGIDVKSTTVVFGDFGLKAMENGYITSNQIESVRMAISRFTKRKGRIWVRIFPDLAITAKPPSRMGGGKSPIDTWTAPVRKGRILFEIGGVDEKTTKGAFDLARHKLPIKVKFVEKV